MGGTLASITSEDELNFIKSNSFFSTQNPTRDEHRIGAKENAGEDGVFYWDLNENLEVNQPWINFEYIKWYHTHQTGLTEFPIEDEQRPGEQDTMLVTLNPSSSGHGSIYAENCLP